MFADPLLLKHFHLKKETTAVALVGLQIQKKKKKTEIFTT